MIKYKVFTNNLDWYDLSLGDIIVKEDGLGWHKPNTEFIGAVQMKSSQKLNDLLMAKILDRHPDWLKKIEEPNYQVLVADHPKEIWKVQRLSDGEIFESGNETYYGVIWKFELRDGIIITLFHGNKNEINLLDLVKKKQSPFFINSSHQKIWDRLYKCEQELVELSKTTQLFTKDDLLEAFEAGERRANYIASEQGIKMEGKFPPFNYWFREYKNGRKK